MRLSKEYRALVASASFSLNEHEAILLSRLLTDDIDMDRFCELIETHLLPHILYEHVYVDNRIEDSLLPPAYAPSLKRKYAFTLMRNSEMYKESVRIATKFKEEGVKLAFLKGTILCKRLYKDLGLRGFGDFDVLVASEDVDKSKELLHELGYESKDEGILEASSYDWSKHPHEQPMTRKGCNPIVPGYCVEIHRPGSYYGIDLQEMLSHSEPVDCGSCKILGLSDVDEAIVLLAHIYQHLLVQYGHMRVSLRMFCEAKECLRLIWLKHGFEKFCARVHEVGANVPVYVSLVFMNCVYTDIVPLILLEELRPRKNVRYEISQTHGAGIAIPASFRLMLLADRVSLAEENWRLNGVSFAETVTNTLIEPGLSEDIVYKEMWKKRSDKHTLLLKTISGAVCLQHGSPVLPQVSWETIPSCFLPEETDLDVHYFGGNVQFSICPEEIGNLKMEFKLAWNYEYLFVLAKVDDSKLMVRDGNVCDGITLNFDVRGKILQYGVFLTSKEGEAQVFKVVEQHGWQLLDDTEAVTFSEIHLGQGYRLEAAIPWSELEVVPSVSEEMMFDIEVIDFRTESDSPHTILVWSGGQGIGWRNSHVFGTMVLTADTICCSCEPQLDKPS